MDETAVFPGFRQFSLGRMVPTAPAHQDSRWCQKQIVQDYRLRPTPRRPSEGGAAGLDPIG